MSDLCHQCHIGLASLTSSWQLVLQWQVKLRILLNRLLLISEFGINDCYILNSDLMAKTLQSHWKFNNSTDNQFAINWKLWINECSIQNSELITKNLIDTVGNSITTLLTCFPSIASSESKTDSCSFLNQQLSYLNSKSTTAFNKILNWQLLDSKFRINKISLSNSEIATVPFQILTTELIDSNYYSCHIFEASEG